jgi:uncharacterized membrane protein (UPF0136 family)
MKFTGTVIFLYGILMFLGGIGAFIKGSGIITISIAIVSAAALVFCSGLINKANFTGVYLSLLISFALGVFFGLKYSKFDDIMPDGILTILSMFAIGFSVYALSNKEQGSKP